MYGMNIINNFKEDNIMRNMGLNNHISHTIHIRNIRPHTTHVSLPFDSGFFNLETAVRRCITTPYGEREILEETGKTVSSNFILNWIAGFFPDNLSSFPHIPKICKKQVFSSYPFHIKFGVDN